MVIQRGEPSPTRGSGNQQDAGPYFVGQIIPVVDHHFKIGVRDRKDAADCVPLSGRMRELGRGSILQCYCVCPGFAYVQYYCA